MPREKAVGKRVERLLDRRQAWWMKTQPPNRNGVTDYLACYRGRFLGIEVKAPGKLGRVAPLQRHEMLKMTRAGGIALAVESELEVKTILDAVDEEIDAHSSGSTARHH